MSKANEVKCESLSLTPFCVLVFKSKYCAHKHSATRAPNLLILYINTSKYLGKKEWLYIKGYSMNRTVKSTPLNSKKHTTQQ